MTTQLGAAPKVFKLRLVLMSRRALRNLMFDTASQPMSRWPYAPTAGNILFAEHDLHHERPCYHSAA